MRPLAVSNPSGTRRYSIEAEEGEVHIFDGVLEAIDPELRNHLTTWRNAGSSLS